jgi:hypothetical protein
MYSIVLVTLVSKCQNINLVYALKAVVVFLFSQCIFSAHVLHRMRDTTSGMLSRGEYKM